MTREWIARALVTSAASATGRADAAGIADGCWFAEVHAAARARPRIERYDMRGRVIEAVWERERMYETGRRERKADTMTGVGGNE